MRPLRLFALPLLLGLLDCGSPALPTDGSATDSHEEASELAITGDAFDVRPARRALRRLVSEHAHQVHLRALPRDGAGDHVRVSGRAGHIVIEGTSPAVLLTGFHAYLTEVVGAHVSWVGERLDLPRVLPAPPSEIVRKANVAHRFALNDTHDGYTDPYADWSRWEHTLDVLALHGVNEVIVYPGAAALYYATFLQFGYSDEELRNWIPLPAHRPWWLLQNMCCFAGPISRQLIVRDGELGRKIAHRLRELGMAPVLPGYFGTVPPSFVDKNPGARVIPQGNWIGFPRPDWLDPRNAHFDKVAEAFYRTQRALFGDSDMFKMDLLHEGGNPGDVPVPEAARLVEVALRKAHPNAIWSILGWQKNPKVELIDALDKSKLLIVDGLSDRYAGLDRETTWHGAPYAFGSIPNFGGHTTLGANLATWNQRYWQWKAKPHHALVGTAYMPEAGDNNPLAFDFFTELAWQEGPVDTAAWFARWAHLRYGGADPHAVAAWEALRTSAFAMSGEDRWSEPHDGLFAARPDLRVRSADRYSPKELRYDPAAVETALKEMLLVAPEWRDTDTYAHDLVDIARQALSNRSRTLLPKIDAAYRAKDAVAFAKLTAAWLRAMDRLEAVTRTDRRFLLGPLVAHATDAALGDAEREQLEYDLRSLYTVWGTRTASEAGLHDYANRELSGLIAGLYQPRWRRYFEELSSALAENRAPRAIDWYAMEESWARTHQDLPTTPSGSPFEAAQAALEALMQE
ncbi:alpha-N-acetylglucosaminidase [Pendulispora brunnea]|uniref:Alpha-N-acetylglucosaminidase n=1 Tax=Pendulispora brunnea TaxID=2905690 RepID=A0ABZ2KGU2_9BACT